ncbi:adenylyltransferase/cytidyltransferase family protein [Candidatus Riflebacteria bacterium]
MQLPASGRFFPTHKWIRCFTCMTNWRFFYSLDEDFFDPKQRVEYSASLINNDTVNKKRCSELGLQPIKESVEAAQFIRLKPAKGRKVKSVVLNEKQFYEFLQLRFIAGLTGKKDFLEQFIQWIKERHLKIAFTNGCFDLLHPGHLHSLGCAAAFADLLFVGINSDSSVKKLKGPKRPLQRLSVRMEILLALECVHLVLPFAEEVPLKLIKRIRPDVLVKGADYRENEIVGADFVRSYGGEVKRIPLLEGFSTTEFLQDLGSL